TEQPSLSSTPSSIFSGGKRPGGGSGSVPTGGSSAIGGGIDGTDSVEFSDHPDPNAADSDSFHLTSGSVEFDQDDSATHPEMTMRAPMPEDEDVDWAGTNDPTAPASGPAAGKLHSGRPAKEFDLSNPTDEMVPAPG